MKVGDLVRHNPEGSAVENILQKLSGDEFVPDFSLGVVVESKNRRMRVFSHQLRDVFWYSISELKKIV